MQLDIHKHILQDRENFSLMLKNRKSDISIGKIESLYQAFKAAQIKHDSLASEHNRLSKNFNQENLYKMQNESDKKNKALNEMHHAKNLSDEKNKALNEMRHARSAYEEYISCVPNLLHEDTQYGDSEKDNLEIYRNKNPEENNSIDETRRHHDVILADYLAKEEATNMSGSKFIAMKGKLATLERKLTSMALDKCIANNFIEASVPALVKSDAMFNTGQFPKFANDFFMIENQCLIPTGEVPLGNLYCRKIIKNHDLPIKLTALTPCFRKESGSLGKDTRGMIRVHQFNKVEMFAICKPKDSNKVHQDLLKMSQSIVDDLDLPYRIVSICSGDIGFTAARQYDIEVWMPGQKKYVEVASISNCWDFQSRRMQIQYEDNDGKHLTHTLNATALAPGRIIAALAENNLLDKHLSLL